VSNADSAFKINEYNRKEHGSLPIHKAQPIFLYRADREKNRTYICNTEVSNDGRRGSDYRNKLYRQSVNFSRKITIDRILN
jgi:hypothetical protein